MFAMFDVLKYFLSKVNPLLIVSLILLFIIGYYHYYKVPNIEKQLVETQNILKVQNEAIIKNKVDYDTNINHYNEAINYINDSYNDKLNSIKKTRIKPSDRNITIQEAKECDAAFNYVVEEFVK